LFHLILSMEATTKNRIPLIHFFTVVVNNLEKIRSVQLDTYLIGKISIKIFFDKGEVLGKI
jgi:hypothetical protein